MSKTFRQLLILSPKRIVEIAIIAAILFLPIYQYLIKGKLLGYFAFNEDELDKVYYSAIFENGIYSLSIIAAFLVIIYLFLPAIKRLIEKLSVIQTLISCLGLQIITQLIIFLTIKTEPISDSLYYIDHALRLAETGSYTSSAGNHTAFWPVALPAIIAVYKYLSLPVQSAMIITNILFSSLLLIVLYYFFKSYLTPDKIKIFIILFTITPNFLFGAQPILTDLPFTLGVWTIFFLTIYHQKKNNYLTFLLIGILLGIASLFRANGLLLLPILVFYFIKERMVSLHQALLVFFGFLLIISPWAVRNYHHFHSLILSSTNGGFNFLMGNHPASSGGVNFDFSYDITNPDEVEEEKKAYSRGIESIINNPLKSFIRIPKKLFYSYWRGDHAITWSLKKNESEIPPILLGIIFFTANGFYYLILLLSVIGFVRYASVYKDRIGVKLIITYSIIILLLIIVYVGGERYVLSLFPIHLFFSLLALKSDN